MRLRWIFFVLISACITQCAKQTAPTGGPTDETPPKLKGSYPEHEQTNFKGDRIELSFDEPIQLNNPREEIIITPSLGKKFEVTFNKNRVTIDLKARPQENTTYNINFRESIQDITEKNPANVKIAFSTGDYIDSLSVNGKVTDALTEEKLGNYTVALAEASDTFNIFKHPASWITITDKKGTFSLENLKPGKYVLYAFNDKSKNLIVDSKSETYGFIAQSLELQKNIDSLKIKTFKMDVNPLKLITARTTFAYFNLRFSKSLVNYSVTSVDTTKHIYSSLEPDLTTIKLYNTIPNLDSLQIRVQAADSLNLKLDTLIYMKFPKKDATKDKLAISGEETIVYESNSTLSTALTFSKPITGFTPDSMFIEVDSLTRIPFTKDDYTWNGNKTKIKINKKIDLNILFPPDTSTATQKAKAPETKAKKPVSIVYRRGTFVSVENDSSNLLNNPIKYVKLESTGIIEAKAKTTESVILQLIDRSGKIAREAIHQNEVSFENLPPDTYTLRAVIDLNKNGKWDAGNFKTRTEPEPIVYYHDRKGMKGIPLKANWTVDQVLITY